MLKHTTPVGLTALARGNAQRQQMALADCRAEHAVGQHPVASHQHPTFVTRPQTVEKNTSTPGVRIGLLLVFDHKIQITGPHTATNWLVRVHFDTKHDYLASIHTCL